MSDSNIDVLAKLLCRGYGFDPNFMHIRGELDVLTDRELDARDPDSHVHSIHVANWQTYRREAAQLLAQQWALQRFAEHLSSAAQ